MDWLVKILQQFSDLHAYWQWFENLCSRDPVWAGLILLPIVLIGCFTVAHQSRRFFEQCKVLLQSTKGRYIISIAVLVSALISCMLVVAARTLNLPRPQITQCPSENIGDMGLTLAWTFDAPKEEPIYYEIQESKTASFHTPEEHYSDQTQCFYPLIGPYNSDTYWRVRALDRDNEIPVSSWSVPAKFSQYDTCLDRIKSTKRVEVYLSNSYDQGYFRYEDRATGQKKGLDIALVTNLVNQLSKKLGIPLEIKWNACPWIDLLNAPQRSEADIIISSITESPMREKDFDIKFTIPYEATGYSLIGLRQGERDVEGKTAIDLFKSATIGVQGGTSSFDFIREFQKLSNTKDMFQIKTYPQVLQELNDLTSGNPQINYLLTDTPFADGAKYLFRIKGKTNLFAHKLTENDVPLNFPKDKLIQNYGLAVRSGDDELLTFLNGFLGKMQSDGSLVSLKAQIRNEYDKSMRAD